MLLVTIQTILIAPLFLFPMVSSIYIYFKLFRSTTKIYLRVLLFLAAFQSFLITLWLLSLFATFQFPSLGARLESLFGELVTHILSVFVNGLVLLSLVFALPIGAGITAIVKNKLFSRGLGVSVVVVVIMQIIFLWLITAFSSVD